MAYWIAAVLDVVVVGVPRAARAGALLARVTAEGTVEAAGAVVDVLADLARWGRRRVAPAIRLGARQLAVGAGYLRRVAAAARVKTLLALGVVELPARRRARDARRVAGAAGRGATWPVKAVARRAPAFGVAGLVVLLTGMVLPGPAVRFGARFVAGDVREGLPPLAQRSAVVAADGSLISVMHGTFDREVVPLDTIPTHVVHLVLAAEDHTYWRHGGYDARGMTRALVADVRARGVVEGGSTITQQLAKQNFVGNEQSVLRKGKEVLYAVALEKQFGKRRLLERYLNQVYLGNGAYGVAAAAEEYFGVPVDKLSVAQAALLAGIIRSPSGLDPRRHPQAARVRRDAVLRAAAREGLVPAHEVRDALRQPLGVVPPPPPPPTSPLIETITRAFLANPAFGRTRADRVRALFRGGLKIETTLDPRLQAEAEHVVRSRFGDPNGPTGAVASVDPGTGAIRALYGGTDQRFDLASLGHRQPGSSFKPFAALAALEKGVPQEITLPGNGPITLDYGGPEKWTVGNYEGEGRGPINLHEALVHSVNTAFAQLAVQIGTDPIVDVARRLGIDVDTDLGPPNARGPAIALGGLARGVTPLEMAAAYATFAANGVHREPFLIARVTDPKGRVVYQHRDAPKQVIRPDLEAAMVGMLQDVVRRGTGVAAQLPGWDPLGKTGTTQDGVDAWFVGAVPQLATAMWVGHAVGRVPMPHATGGTIVAPMWHDFMSVALEGVAPAPFPLSAAPPPPPPPAPRTSSRGSVSVAPSTKSTLTGGTGKPAKGHGKG